MIQKKCTSTCRTISVDSTANVEQLENGQIVIHVTAQNEGASFGHRITVGALDGNDALTNLTDDELKAALQSHLDQVRQKAVDVLAARSKVKELASQLT